MAKIFHAKTAKKIVTDFYENDLNWQRSMVMDRIEREALRGKSSIVLDDSMVKLFDEDYNFFKKLGYKVYPEEITRYSSLSDKLEYYKHVFGIISWED